MKQIKSYIIITECMINNYMFYNNLFMVFQESWNWADCRGEKRSIAQRPLSADWYFHSINVYEYHPNADIDCRYTFLYSLIDNHQNHMFFKNEGTIYKTKTEIVVVHLIQSLKCNIVGRRSASVCCESVHPSVKKLHSRLLLQERVKLISYLG